MGLRYVIDDPLHVRVNHHENMQKQRAGGVCVCVCLCDIKATMNHHNDKVHTNTSVISGVQLWLQPTEEWEPPQARSDWLSHD